MDERQRWLDRILTVRRWSRAGQRAPHKPLLLLYAVGRLQRTGSSAMAYSEVEADLDRLLLEFGPARATSPAYPFHHLQTDELWTVDAAGDPGPSRAKLRSSGAVGRLTPDLEAALLADPALLALVGHSLLEANFPESLHHDLAAAAGLDLIALDAQAAPTLPLPFRRRRDPAFRDAVLVAYEYRCAMCGYDGWLGGESVGLDAAHLRWWAFEGPDTVENALCLCSLHHKLLDRGVMGMTGDRRVAVSSWFVGRGRVAEELVLRLVGQELLEPQRGQPAPADDHIAWHNDEVFRGPARVPA